MLKYAPALVLLLAAGPVFAQGSSQTPPAPGSAASGPQSNNSLPAGASNMNQMSNQNPNPSMGATGATLAAPGPGAASSQTLPVPASK